LKRCRLAPAGLSQKETSRMKKFQLVKLGCTLAALAAVLVDLGAGHKF
jgi:hypothetical protein